MNQTGRGDKPVYIEVLHEGPHCIACEYMAKVVAAAAAKFEDQLEWHLVVLTRKEGAVRFDVLSRELGRLAPVPSIFINGKLVFDTIPAVEELDAQLHTCLQHSA